MPLTPFDIPYTAPFTEATMEHTHVRMDVTPTQAPTLRYDLALPKHWVYSKQFGPVSVGLFQPQGLGFFARSSEPGAPVVAVTATAIPFEVPVDAWVRLALQREGWEIVAGRWFPGPNGLFFDVTGVRTTDDLELVRRTSARVEGSHIICVNSLCSRLHWDAIKEDFWTAHVTFALLAASGNTQMESWVRAACSNPDFETVHPLSWTSEVAESSDGSTSGVHIRLVNDAEQTLLAYMLVRAAIQPNSERPAMPALLTDTMTTLTKSGLTLSGTLQPLSEQEDPRSLGVKGWLGGHVGIGHLGQGDVTVRIGFVQRGVVVFTLVSYSPKLEDDLLVALRAQRAFEIARAGLHAMR